MICNPPSKNVLTFLCSGDLQSPAPRLLPAYRWDRGLQIPQLMQRRICPVLRQASRRICNPPLKNDLTSLCSGDLQSPATRLLPAYRWDRGLQIPRLNRSNLFYDGQHIRRDAQRKTALCIIRRKGNITQQRNKCTSRGHQIRPRGKNGRRLHVFAHAYAASRRNLCRPPGRLCRNNIISYKKYIV